MRKWILFLLVLTQCNEDLQPKPTAYLRLEYPKSEYQQTNNSPYFSFEYNRQALVNAENKSAPRLVYPQMKATLYLNYSSIKKI